MSRFAQAAKSLLLVEFVSAFWLAMKYFVAPKATLNYPFEKDAPYVAFKKLSSLVE